MTLKDFLNTNDRFAAQTGAELTEIREGYARAEMTVTANHLNGGGVCQGGALFTLADLAFAAVTNSHGALSLGIESHIVYSRSAQLGDRLTAEAREIAPHHRLPYCEVKISNQRGELLCSFTGIAYSKSGQQLPVDGLM